MDAATGGPACSRTARGRLRRAERSRVPDDAYVALLGADGDELDDLADLADGSGPRRSATRCRSSSNRNLDGALLDR